MAGFLTLNGSWPWPWIGSYCIPSYITHWPLPICQISLKLKKLFVDGRMYVRTYIRTDGHLRPALLGRLCRRVYLKTRSSEKTVRAIVHEGSPEVRSETMGEWVEGFVKKVGFKPGVKERRSYGWSKCWIKTGSDGWKIRWVGNGGTGTRIRLTEWQRKLIPETWWSIPKRAIGYFYTVSNSNDNYHFLGWVNFSWTAWPVFSNNWYVTGRGTFEGNMCRPIITWVHCLPVAMGECACPVHVADKRILPPRAVTKRQCSLLPNYFGHLLFLLHSI